MELLDTDDPIKRALLTKTDRHRRDLEEEARALSERTEKIITNAVVIGGALALTYFLYTQLSGSKKKKEKNKVRESEGEENEETNTSTAGTILSQVGTALVSQGGVFLLALAKEKLMEYLRAQGEKNKESK